jgi:hypothetical protein
MAKKSYDDVTEPEVAAAPPPPHILTLMDGTRPVWVRKSAVEAFTTIGDPVVQFRVLLQSGTAFFVNPTDEAKDALLDALVE